MRFTISAVAAVVLQATSGSACTTSNEANTDCEPITDENLGSIQNGPWTAWDPSDGSWDYIPGSAMYDFSLDGLRWGSVGRDKWGDIDDW
jgi:hypothetical protein